MPKKKQPTPQTPKPRKPRPEPKLRKHEIALVVVGLNYRLTTSTRRLLADKLKSEPIFCDLIREPDNRHDENAVKVVVKEGSYKGMHIGYIQRGVAAVLAVLMDEGGIQDETFALVSLDVEQGECDAVFHFMAPKIVQVGGTPKLKTA